MSIEIRKGDWNDTENFIRLLDDVKAAMEHKEWFYLDAPEDVRKMMADGTMQLWVAMDGDRLAGAFSILVHGLGEHNYGYDLGFSEDQLLKTINMDTAAVHPDYRGQKLQKRLMERAEEDLKGAGERILLCTIHPENRYSLQNALSLGYVIQKELPKYGSVRYLLRKDIS